MKADSAVAATVQSAQPPSVGAPDASRRSPGASVWRALCERERVLAWFGLLMLLAMLPTAGAALLDERVLRGASIWAKPLKFQASIAVFALSTAWFIGLLPVQRRRAAVVRGLVWTLVLAGGLEVAYITLQAALGEASHYNRSSLAHQVAYLAMGAGALAMMATQPVLAWQIQRHASPDEPAIWRQAVVLGLVLTFVLGVGAAAPLASAPPPDGSGWPLLGWQLSAGDLRPAHFVGSHAQQVIPLVGWMLAGAWARAIPVRAARMVLAWGALAYSALWAALLLIGLQSARWLPPPLA